MGRAPSLCPARSKARANEARNAPLPKVAAGVLPPRSSSSARARRTSSPSPPSVCPKVASSDLVADSAKFSAAFTAITCGTEGASKSFQVARAPLRSPAARRASESANFRCGSPAKAAAFKLRRSATRSPRNASSAVLAHAKSASFNSGFNPSRARAAAPGARVASATSRVEKRGAVARGLASVACAHNARAPPESPLARHNAHP